MKHENILLHNAAELTFDEIAAYYADQWVLIAETAWNDDGEPIRGVVEAHSQIRDELIQPTQQLHRRQPNTKTYTLYTGEQVTENLVSTSNFTFDSREPLL